MSKGPLPDTPPDHAALRRQLDQAEAALRASRQREELLRGELEHRVRNVLSVTRSVFSRTMDNAASIEDARDHFHGRLSALARYHGRLAALPGTTFLLETLVWDELTAVASANHPQIHVEGPAVYLGPRTAEALGLVLHELATNSVKFGVLGDYAHNGRLRVEWRVSDAQVAIAWRETGIPIVMSAPLSSGFGRELIEHGLPYQLGATTSFAIIPGGLICSIAFANNGALSEQRLVHDAANAQ